MKKIIYYYESYKYKSQSELEFIRVTITKYTINIVFGNKNLSINKSCKYFENVLEKFEQIPFKDSKTIGHMILDGWNESLKIDGVDFLWVMDEIYLKTFKKVLYDIIKIDLVNYCTEYYNKMEEFAVENETVLGL